jgi:hypothetical protein
MSVVVIKNPMCNFQKKPSLKITFVQTCGDGSPHLLFSAFLICTAVCFIKSERREPLGLESVEWVKSVIIP